MTDSSASVWRHQWSAALRHAAMSASRAIRPFNVPKTETAEWDKHASVLHTNSREETRAHFDNMCYFLQLCLSSSRESWAKHQRHQRHFSWCLQPMKTRSVSSSTIKHLIKQSVNSRAAAPWRLIIRRDRTEISAPTSRILTSACFTGKEKRFHGPICSRIKRRLREKREDRWLQCASTAQFWPITIQHLLYVISN